MLLLLHSLVNRCAASRGLGAQPFPGKRSRGLPGRHAHCVARSQARADLCRTWHALALRHCTLAGREHIWSTGKLQALRHVQLAQMRPDNLQLSKITSHGMQCPLLHCTSLPFANPQGLDPLRACADQRSLNSLRGSVVAYTSDGAGRPLAMHAALVWYLLTATQRCYDPSISGLCICRLILLVGPGYSIFFR